MYENIIFTKTINSLKKNEWDLYYRFAMNHAILIGTRGIPGNYGGFETCAEKLALYLAERGWNVTVYCHDVGAVPLYTDNWNGITRIHISTGRIDALGLSGMVYDWRSILDARKRPGVILTFGYNTALFNFVFRILRRPNIINMDGIEWKRKRGKWSVLRQIWLYVNEQIACRVGNHLIADHPEIEKYLAQKVSSTKITTIWYGAFRVTSVDENLLSNLGVFPNRFALVIARPFPENLILEIVRAFSKKNRNCLLVVLGNYNPDKDPYHRLVLDAASKEVLFPGAIYDPQVVEALRLHCKVYIHGHTLGGTNPSLVEALGAGSAVIAHDNPYNRWVAGKSTHFFKDESECSNLMDELLDNEDELKRMRQSSRERFEEDFTWEKVLGSYEQLLLQWVNRSQGSSD